MIYRCPPKMSEAFNVNTAEKMITEDIKDGYGVNKFNYLPSGVIFGVSMIEPITGEQFQQQQPGEYIQKTYRIYTKFLDVQLQDILKINDKLYRITDIQNWYDIYLDLRIWELIYE